MKQKFEAIGDEMLHTLHNLDEAQQLVHDTDFGVHYDSVWREVHYLQGQAEHMRVISDLLCRHLRAYKRGTA